MKFLLPLMFALNFWLTSCATVHQVAINEMHPERKQHKQLDVKAGAYGFDVAGAGRLSKSLTESYGNKNASEAGSFLATLVWATTWAPATGYLTTTDTWADQLTRALSDQCKNGVVANLQVVRETADYPLVSGEIVRAHAQCLEWQENQR